MRKFTFLLTILLLLTGNLYSQRLLQISVIKDTGEDHLSFISRKGIDYISSKDLARLLGVNYYYNTTADKIELKFEEKNIIFTARNQFVILKDKNRGDKQIYQIPLSTMLIRSDVFLPFVYVRNLLETASGLNLNYNPDEKNLTISKGSTRNEIIVKKDEPKIKSVDSKFDVYDIQVKDLTNGTLLTLYSKNKLTQISKPFIQNNTLFMSISSAVIDPSITKNLKAEGLIKSVKIRKLGYKNYQLECKLKKGYENVSHSYDEEDNLMISIHSKMFNKSIDLNSEKKKWKLDVIVIDAGHGGKDAGAIGVRGTKEKDINLSIALKLGKLLEKHFRDSVKIVYTRKTDKFVELYKRGKIANENDGKLFISIHCNSLKKKPSKTRGYEIYLLRPGKTKDAIEIAEVENSVIELEENPQLYKKLDEENFILVSMAHSAYMRYSEEFSAKLNNTLRKYVSIPSRGIKQAGFYVLVGASMPGILFETGFLSNRLDEAYLRSKTGQTEMAKGIFHSILEYKKFYDNYLN